MRWINSLKNTAVLLICCVTALHICLPGLRASAMFTPTFDLQSKAAILYSTDTKEVLYAKNQDEKMMPGALVNLMTALICVENNQDLAGTQVTVKGSLFDAFVDYSYPSDLRYGEIYRGDVFTLEELLYAMLLTSSCEASVVIADEIGHGSVPGFVAMMNLKAEEIGMKNTHFTNPDGRYNENQVTTAGDMLLMMQYIQEHASKVLEIARTASYSPQIRTQENHQSGTLTWSHANIMMDEESRFYYKGAAGLKTATLQEYGRNIMVDAARDGHHYLVILMQSPIYNENKENTYYHLQDAAAVLDWAFGHFNYEEILSLNEEIAEIPVENAKNENNYVILKPREELVMLWPDTVDRSVVQRIVVKEDSVKAPVQKGQVLGSIELRFGGETLTKVDLIATSDVEQSFVRFNLSAAREFRHSKWMKTALILSIVLTVLYLGVCIYFTRIYPKRTKPIRGLVRDKRKKGTRIRRD